MQIKASFISLLIPTRHKLHHKNQFTVQTIILHRRNKTSIFFKNKKTGLDKQRGFSEYLFQELTHYFFGIHSFGFSFIVTDNTMTKN